VFEPKPSWQNALVPGTMRGVADVAFDSYPGVELVLDGKKGPGYYGGTSLSAPLFAGLWARVIAMRGTNVGFAGPLIYALPETDFHDVTSGNNDGETAEVGYDYPTGRGSIILSNAIEHIPGGEPPTANFEVLTSSLTAFFTDSSADSEGTIASHSWNFGDGKTSTGINPDHAYATAGIYSVSETITNEAGQSSTRTESVAAGGTQLLQNTGFETGTATPWMITPASVLTNNASLAHSSKWFAAIGGGAGASTDYVSQLVTIPSGKKSAKLTFYLHTTTTETTKTARSDVLYVQVRSPTGTVLSQLASYSNLNATSGYVLYNLDLSAYIGQQVKVMFVGVNNATLPTTWDLDDVRLWVQ
jgi:PKD repeat protein